MLTKEFKEKLFESVLNRYYKELGSSDEEIIFAHLSVGYPNLTIIEFRNTIDEFHKYKECRH